MTAHGGYLFRLESVEATAMVALARQALQTEGPVLDGCQLRLSVIPRRKVVRLAYEAPFATGTPWDPSWYEDHHALARLISQTQGVTVHAYVYLPESHEQVRAYGNGRPVGGDRLRYDDVDLPQQAENDDAAFEEIRSRWPLGHLAYVFGIPRAELLGLPWREPQLLPIFGAAANEVEIPVRRRRREAG